MVRPEGLEPPLLAEQAPKACVAAITPRAQTNFQNGTLEGTRTLTHYGPHFECDASAIPPQEHIFRR